MIFATARLPGPVQSDFNAVKVTQAASHVHKREHFLQPHLTSPHLTTHTHTRRPPAKYVHPITCFHYPYPTHITIIPN